MAGQGVVEQEMPLQGKAVKVGLEVVAGIQPELATTLAVLEDSVAEEAHPAHLADSRLVVRVGLVEVVAAPPAHLELLAAQAERVP